MAGDEESLSLRGATIMKNLTKLDASVIHLLCCPLCKGNLEMSPSRFVCEDCQSSFPLTMTSGGEVFDFRIHRPPYVIPKPAKKWQETQRNYEDWDNGFAAQDSLQEYLDEIDSVGEIYGAEFHLAGSILDVGGHVGRLRHFLSGAELATYVSVDPFLDAFRSTQQPNFLKAYPCLSEPCNFLACQAEYLPFVPRSFDWVHMRSVVDHFADPYVAFKEAFRILKPNGSILVGLSIIERMRTSQASRVAKFLRKLNEEGVLPTLEAIARTLVRMVEPVPEYHNYQLKHKELLDLFAATGFRVTKEHWQKPPYTYVIYASARKLDS
jgi:SAM-dependent methyltransferase